MCCTHFSNNDIYMYQRCNKNKEFFRIDKSLEFNSSFQQSTTITCILLKVTLTYLAVTSTLNYLFLTQKSSTILLRHQSHVKKKPLDFYINFSF